MDGLIDRFGPRRVLWRKALSSKAAKWRLSLKSVIKDYHRSAEVMAVLKERHQRLPKFC